MVWGLFPQNPLGRAVLTKMNTYVQTKCLSECNKKIFLNEVEDIQTPLQWEWKEDDCLLCKLENIWYTGKRKSTVDCCKVFLLLGQRNELWKLQGLGVREYIAHLSGLGERRSKLVTMNIYSSSWVIEGRRAGKVFPRFSHPLKLL